MQVTETIVLCIVDYNSVHIGHVDAALNDSRRQQNVIVVVGEVDDALFKLLGGHLAMCHHHACVGHKAVDHGIEVVERLNAVVYKEHLAVA